MRKILLIEDNEGDAALVMRKLRQEGFICSLSLTFADGVERANREAWDCIVVDAGLPDTAGDHDTLGRLEELGETPKVVFTGSGDPSLISAARATGAALVGKPGGDLLVEKVWSQINYRRAARDSELGQMDAQRRLQAPAEEPRRRFFDATVNVTHLLWLIGIIGSLGFGAFMFVMGHESRIKTLETERGEVKATMKALDDTTRAMAISLAKIEAKLDSAASKKGQP